MPVPPGYDLCCVKNRDLVCSQLFDGVIAFPNCLIYLLWPEGDSCQWNLPPWNNCCDNHLGTRIHRSRYKLSNIRFALFYDIGLPFRKEWDCFKIINTCLNQNNVRFQISHVRLEATQNLSCCLATDATIDEFCCLTI